MSHDLTAQMRNAIAQRIHALFGEEYRIYPERVRQGLQLPAFFLRLIEVSEKKIFWQRYARRYLFEITFEPEQESRMDAADMAEQLISHLEWVPMEDGWIRGTDPRIHMADGILVMSLWFSLVVRKKPSEEEKMEKVQVKSKVKE